MLRSILTHMMLAIVLTSCQQADVLESLQVDVVDRIGVDGSVGAIDVDSDGNLYVLDRANSQILTYSAGNDSLLSVIQMSVGDGPDQVGRPTDFAAADGGYVAWLSRESRKLYIINPAGEVEDVYPTRFLSSSVEYYRGDYYLSRMWMFGESVLFRITLDPELGAIAAETSVPLVNRPSNWEAVFQTGSIAHLFVSGSSLIYAFPAPNKYIVVDLESGTVVDSSKNQIPLTSPFGVMESSSGRSIPILTDAIRAVAPYGDGGVLVVVGGDEGYFLDHYDSMHRLKGRTSLANTGVDSIIDIKRSGENTYYAYGFADEPEILKLRITE